MIYSSYLVYKDPRGWRAIWGVTWKEIGRKVEFLQPQEESFPPLCLIHINLYMCNVRTCYVCMHVHLK